MPHELHRQAHLLGQGDAELAKLAGEAHRICGLQKARSKLTMHFDCPTDHPSRNLTSLIDLHGEPLRALRLCCVVNAHVAGGRIVHISTDQRRWNPDHPPLPACARGVGQIERTYHPDRLQHPLHRVGPRGAGRFECICWDEALDRVAREMLRIRAAYGNAAILDASRTGSQSMLHGRVAAQRFLYMFGGCTDLWSNLSAEAEVFAVHMTYGAKTEYKTSGREPTDYANSKLILMWG